MTKHPYTHLVVAGVLKEMIRKALKVTTAQTASIEMKVLRILRDFVQADTDLGEESSPSCSEIR